MQLQQAAGQLLPLINYTRIVVKQHQISDNAYVNPKLKNEEIHRNIKMQKKRWTL